MIVQVAIITGAQCSAKRAAAIRELLLPLNVPRLVGQQLAARNPDSTVLYWKLVLLQGAANALDSAQEWLRSKLSLDRSPSAICCYQHTCLPITHTVTCLLQ